MLAIVLGAIAAFGLAPYNLWPLTILVLASVPVQLYRLDKSRDAAWIGWALGLGYFGHGLIWIVEPFLVDIGRHGWMAPFALVLLAGGLALFWGLSFYVAHRVGRTATARIFLLILTLSLAEFARAYVLTGFPWAALAQIWVSSDTALILAWVGPHGLATLTLLASFLPGLALVHTGPTLIRLSSFLPMVALPLTGLGLAHDLPEVYPTSGIVRIVQPNAPQHQKWDPDFIPVFFDRQIDYTAQLPRPDLIVWPETSVPTLLEYADQALEVIAEAASGSQMVLGVQRREGNRNFNSLIRLDEKGDVAAIYDKHHLVPFGEYFPGGDAAAQFGLRGFAAREGDGYSKGPGPEVMGFGQLGLAVPLICYEAVFPQDVAGTPVRGDFLLQITNDAWFGQYAGPYQHLAQARMRAIEQGLPMVRSANTGISAMIDPKGRTIKSLGLGETGYVDVALPKPLPPTLYAITGDFPLLVLLLIGFFVFWFAGRKLQSVD